MLTFFPRRVPKFKIFLIVPKSGPSVQLGKTFDFRLSFRFLPLSSRMKDEGLVEWLGRKG